MDLKEIFERLKGHVLLLLSDGSEEILLVRRTILFGDKDFWVSEPFVEPNEIHTFMMNDIEWINPIGAVIAIEALDWSITCEKIFGYLIRAYDDDGYIYVGLHS